MNTDTWRAEIRFSAPLGEMRDLLAEELIGLGSNGVEEILIRRKTIGLRAHYSLRRKGSTLRKELKALVSSCLRWTPNVRLRSIHVKRFTDRSWQDRWKKFAKPVIFGSRLAILPSHIQKLPRSFPENGTVFRIDPGMAFGTGSHPTTHLCIEAMLDLSDAKKGKFFPAVLDCGTGTGILALVAQALGARKIHALDIDPEAVRVARENLALHQAERHITLACQQILDVDGRFSLVIGNLILGVIERELPNMLAKLAEDGTLLLSGILEREEKELRAILRGQNLTLIKLFRKRRWIAAIVKRKRSTRKKPLTRS